MTERNGRETMGLNRFQAFHTLMDWVGIKRLMAKMSGDPPFVPGELVLAVDPDQVRREYLRTPRERGPSRRRS